MKKYDTVDEYIDHTPEPARGLLKRLRQLVLETVPDVEEKCSYGMPYYGYKGRLLYFGGFKDHVSLFPMKTGIEAFKVELEDYETSAGTIKFPLDKPLPIDLITKIIKFRVDENNNRRR